MNDYYRQLRFLVPPTLFLGSLSIGAYFARGTPTWWVSELDVKDILGIAAVLAGLAIPLGFLITSASVLLMRIAFFVIKRGHYEAHVTEGGFKAIWMALGLDQKVNYDRWRLYALVTLAHGLLDERVHAWIQRRWSIFHASMNSAIAAVLAFLSGPLVGIAYTFRWAVFTLIIALILTVNGAIAWREVMTMIEFQAYSTTRFPGDVSSPTETRQE